MLLNSAIHGRVPVPYDDGAFDASPIFDGQIAVEDEQVALNRLTLLYRVVLVPDDESVPGGRGWFAVR